MPTLDKLIIKHMAASAKLYFLTELWKASTKKKIVIPFDFIVSFLDILKMSGNHWPEYRYFQK